MPDAVVHNAMGERVLQELEKRIADSIDRKIFGVGVLGPDPFLFYRFFAVPLRLGINRRSNVMHETKTGRFLMELAVRSDDRGMFSYLAGFLCHYALDSTAHPWVNRLSEGRSDLHTAIEHRLDVMELKRQGKERRDIPKLFMPYPDLNGIREAMKAVYGWDDHLFETSYRHMRWYHYLIRDQHGFLNFLLHRLPGYVSVISYRQTKADGMDLSPFPELEEKAIALAVRLITALDRYLKGMLSLEELRGIIGNRSYAGGEALE